MTYEQLENNYKTKKEKLDTMLELKTKDEILALYEDKSFCGPGSDKTDRFFAAFMKTFGPEEILSEQSEDNDPEPEEAFQQPQSNAENSQEENKAKAYTAAWPIRCGDKVWTAGQRVSAEEFGADFKRLLEIGALVQK